MLFLCYFLLVILTPIFTECLHINVDSSITHRDYEIIIKSGDSLNLTCVGNTPLEWTYPEYNASAIAEPPSITAIGTEIKNGDEYSLKLSLQNAVFMDTGFFSCHPAGQPPSQVDQTPSATSLYVFVEDDNHILAVPEGFMLIAEQQYHTLVIPCRPTSPSVNVSLFDTNNNLVTDVTFDPHKGFIKENVQLDDAERNFECRAVKDSNSVVVYIYLYVTSHSDSIGTPYINDSRASHVLIGDTAILDCSVKVDPGIIVTLEWVIPHPEDISTGHVVIEDVPHETIPNALKQIIEHKLLKIKNVTARDQDVYICNVTDHSHNVNQNSYHLHVADNDLAYLNLTVSGKGEMLAAAGTKSVTWAVNIDSYPQIDTIEWYRYNYTGHKIRLYADSENKKYEITSKASSSKLTINHLDLWDSGLYSLFVSNRINDLSKSLNLSLIFQGAPKVRMPSEGFYKQNESHKITCNVAAYEGNITWHYKKCADPNECEPSSFQPFTGRITNIPNKLARKVYVDSIAEIKTNHSLLLNCSVCNIISCDSELHSFHVSDVDGGFAIVDPPESVVERDNVTLKCAASRHMFKKGLMWAYANRNADFPLNETNNDEEVINYENELSHYSIVKLKNIGLNNSGTYKCMPREFKDEEDRESQIRSIRIVVQRESPPVIENVSFPSTQKIMAGLDIKWVCPAIGNPKPIIVWLKNDNEIKISERNRSPNSGKPHIQILNDNTTLEINNIGVEDEGTYRCKAINRVNNDSKAVFLKVHSPEQTYGLKMWIWTFAALVFLLAIVIISLVYKERKLKKDLTAAGLVHFEEGAVESINPDLHVSEQADLLPYNRKFEFPRDKLKLGKQLGSGAFGVVLKAEADGIMEPGVKTTVAVKMVKQSVDLSHIKALASELKIMIHLGGHANVVNLLGACTRNLKNRELLVIVEYCPFGNLHKYLLEHRDTFINQVNPRTGKIDPTIITSSVKPKYVNLPNITSTSQSNATGRLSSQLEEGLQFNSAGTEVTSVSTPIGEDGYLICREPLEWTQSKQRDSKASQPISTQDLLCWSFQIARGMEYLASRKVLHGDLAARNILLSDNNVVKICDFGLSKNMYAYQNDNYVKKGKRLLPVKWMAIEAIRDRNFSIQSDVWAYGIVLWELFTLARTPYPGLEDVEKLLHKLEVGYRMEIPQYSTKELYEVMTDCWHARPSMRPSFTDLATKLGDMLEDSVRQHYVDLNDPFLAENAAYLSQRDYLSMLNSPTYANLDRETGETLNRGASGYTSMRQRSDAQEDTELRPMLSPLSGRNGSLSEIDSIPNSPVATASPTGNFVTVTEAAEVQGFSNPTYHNLDRPPINPYMNAPYVIEKEGRPFGLQWNTSNMTTE